jgi:hypothetical protein
MSLTEAQARAVIAPWHALFSQPVQGDMRTLQEQILTRTTSRVGAISPANAGAVTPPSRWSEPSRSRSRICGSSSRESLFLATAWLCGARSRELRRENSSARRTPARASGSWPSTSRRSETERSRGPTTSKTGSALWGSSAPSSTHGGPAGAPTCNEQRGAGNESVKKAHYRHPAQITGVGSRSNTFSMAATEV